MSDSDGPSPAPAAAASVPGPGSRGASGDFSDDDRFPSKAPAHSPSGRKRRRDASSSSSSSSRRPLRSRSILDPSYPLRSIPHPGPNDVVLGRGGGTNSHPGNVRFRKLVAAHKLRYLAAGKTDKPRVAHDVVTEWRRMVPPGRFLAKDAGGGMRKGDGSKEWEGGEGELWHDGGAYAGGKIGRGIGPSVPSVAGPRRTRAALDVEKSTGPTGRNVETTGVGEIPALRAALAPVRPKDRFQVAKSGSTALALAAEQYFLYCAQRDVRVPSDRARVLPNCQLGVSGAGAGSSLPKLSRSASSGLSPSEQKIVWCREACSSDEGPKSSQDRTYFPSSSRPWPAREKSSQCLRERNGAVNEAVTSLVKTVTATGEACPSDYATLMSKAAMVEAHGGGGGAAAALPQQAEGARPQQQAAASKPEGASRRHNKTWETEEPGGDARRLTGPMLDPMRQQQRQSNAAYASRGLGVPLASHRDGAFKEDEHDLIKADLERQRMHLLQAQSSINRRLLMLQQAQQGRSRQGGEFGGEPARLTSEIQRLQMSLQLQRQQAQQGQMRHPQPSGGGYPTQRNDRDPRRVTGNVSEAEVRRELEAQARREMEASMERGRNLLFQQQQQQLRQQPQPQHRSHDRGDADEDEEDQLIEAEIQQLLQQRRNFMRDNMS
ncbi:hypothetical protein ACHAWF_009252 [Thalassiosira exigua]